MVLVLNAQVNTASAQAALENQDLTLNNLRVNTDIFTDSVKTISTEGTIFSRHYRITNKDTNYTANSSYVIQSLISPALNMEQQTLFFSQYDSNATIFIYERSGEEEDASWSESQILYTGFTNQPYRISTDGTAMAIISKSDMTVVEYSIYTKSSTSWQISIDTTMVPSPTYQSDTDVKGDLIIFGSGGNGVSNGQVIVYERNSNGDWVNTDSLTNGTYFGVGCAIAGDNIIVGKPDQKQIIIYGKSGGSWSQIQTITKSSATNFGIQIRGSENNFIVSSHERPLTSFTRDYNDRKLWVYGLSGTTWVEQQELNLNDVPYISLTESTYNFGNQFDISGDYIAVGSDGSITSEYSTFVLLYSKTGSSWELTKYIRDGWDSVHYPGIGSFNTMIPNPYSRSIGFGAGGISLDGTGLTIAHQSNKDWPFVHVYETSLPLQLTKDNMRVSNINCKKLNVKEIKFSNGYVMNGEWLRYFIYKTTVNTVIAEDATFLPEPGYP